jgi:hypothetical protein
VIFLLTPHRARVIGESTRLKDIQIYFLGGAFVRRCVSMAGVLAVLLLCGGAASAQDKKAGGKKAADKKPAKARRVLPRYYKNLGLTDEQKQKVYGIQGKYKDRIAALNRQLKEIRAQQKAELETVLNAQQKAKLKEASARRKSRTEKTTTVEPKKTGSSKRKGSKRKTKSKKDEKPAKDQ